MKKSIIVSILMVTSLLGFSSCGDASSSITSSGTSGDSIASQSSASASYTDAQINGATYQWPFKNKMAYNGVITPTITANLGNLDLDLKLDDKLLPKLPSADTGATIYYDVNPDHPPHSYSVEHAHNEIKINGKNTKDMPDYLPAEGNEGIYLSPDALQNGENIFSVTIGQVYASKVYSLFESHGGLNGAGDDFEIGNMRLVTSSGATLKPTKMVFWKPKAIKGKEYVKKEVQQEDDVYYRIGDGWYGDLSYDGNPTTTSDCPFRIDYYFDYALPQSVSSYSIDTTQYTNALHNLQLLANGKTVKNYQVYFDNTEPIISSNIDEMGFVNKNFKLHFDIDDDVTRITSFTAKIDDTVIENDITLSKFSVGKHSLNITATDFSGNITYFSRDFTIAENHDTLKYDKTTKKVSTPYQNTINSYGYEVTKLSPNKTTGTENGVNYEEFTVGVTEASKPLYLTYNGEVAENEYIKIEVLNPITNTYEEVTKVLSKQDISFKLEPQNYVSNNQVKFRAIPLYKTNGSNRMLWSSDTQYLPKVTEGNANFSDINYMYGDLMTYMADEYKSSRMNYMCHTGDIVDATPDYPIAATEWKNADEAFKILDENKVPYGVSAGNHDVSTSKPNYSYYSKYFGNNRYNQTDIYGGTLNDNQCHYDLVSVGNYDFIFVYLGYGVEAKPDTIAWANKVLKQYPNRNAVVATHAFLLTDGKMDPNSNADTIYDKIVKPNDNVKFIFCGHTDGNAVVPMTANGKTVYAMLNCYQFVQTQQYENSHIINGYTCNGEAIIRELMFGEDSVSWNTFSPVLGIQDPKFNASGTLDSGTNSGEITNIGLIPSNRTISTKDFTVCQINTSLFGPEDSTEGIQYESNKNYMLYSDAADGAYGFMIF